MGNAGDGVVNDFTQRARNIYAAMENLGFDKFPEVEQMKLQNIIYTAQVVSEVKVERNEIAVDALNFPTERKIIVNRDRFPNLQGKEKDTIVLHEYLGLLGIEFGSYYISNKIMDIVSNMNVVTDCEVKTKIYFYFEGYDENENIYKQAELIAQAEQSQQLNYNDSHGFVPIKFSSYPKNVYNITNVNHKYKNIEAKINSYFERYPLLFMLYLERNPYGRLNAISFYMDNFRSINPVGPGLIKNKQLTWNAYTSFRRFGLETFLPDLDPTKHFYKFDLTLTCSLK